jgi:hypothetical protein
MISLPSTTLWACCWSDNSPYARTRAVLEYCMRNIKFAHVIWFCYLPTDAPDGVELIQIPRLDISQWNIFANRVMPLAITTDYAMSVHEDGFPLDFSLWSPEFLDYDYIGAPWNDNVVGNGGFAIESRRLLNAKMRLPFSVEGNHPRYVGMESAKAVHPPSDVYVCRIHRAALEQQGIRFAPQDVALRFSTEQTGWAFPSFGFHGKLGTPNKYQAGWNKIIAEQ